MDRIAVFAMAKVALAQFLGNAEMQRGEAQSVMLVARVSTVATTWPSCLTVKKASAYLPKLRWANVDNAADRPTTTGRGV